MTGDSTKLDIMGLNLVNQADRTSIFSKYVAEKGLIFDVDPNGEFMEDPTNEFESDPTKEYRLPKDYRGTCVQWVSEHESEAYRYAVPSEDSP